MLDLLLGSLTGLVSLPPAGARLISSHWVRLGQVRLGQVRLGSIRQMYAYQNIIISKYSVCLKMLIFECMYIQIMYIENSI